MSKNPDIFNKTNRNDRLKQMSQQQQLIEEKKRQIQKKIEEQKRREAEEALRASKGDQIGSDEKINPNVFTNDGSFLDHFRKIANREGNEARDLKQNRDRSRSPCNRNDPEQQKKQIQQQIQQQFQQQIQQQRQLLMQQQQFQQLHQHQFQQPHQQQHQQQQRQQLLAMARVPPPPPPPPIPPQNIPAPSPLIPQSIPPPSPLNPQSIPPPTPLVPQCIPPPCPPPVPPPVLSLPTGNYNLPPSLLVPPPPPPPPLPMPCNPPSLPVFGVLPVSQVAPTLANDFSGLSSQSINPSTSPSAAGQIIAEEQIHSSLPPNNPPMINTVTDDRNYCTLPTVPSTQNDDKSSVSSDNSTNSVEENQPISLSINKESPPAIPLLLSSMSTSLPPPSPPPSTLQEESSPKINSSPVRLPPLLLENITTIPLEPPPLQLQPSLSVILQEQTTSQDNFPTSISQLPPVSSLLEVPADNIQGDDTELHVGDCDIKMEPEEPDEDSKSWFIEKEKNQFEVQPAIPSEIVKMEVKSEEKSDIPPTTQPTQTRTGERKRKSRWGDSTKTETVSSTTTPAVPVPPSSAPIIKVPGMSGYMISKVTRTDPGLLQYTRTAYGSTNLSEEDWKKAEDNYKVHLLYQDMMAKREQVERLRAMGKNKYEYDSDEETDGGTWEHKLREKEMDATKQWAESLTEMAKGKHHIGDFLPPDELKRFMDKYSAVKGAGEPDLSDYKEFKLKEDNKGFQMLQKLGWTEGQGLGSDGGGILDPINKAQSRDHQGLGLARPGEVTSGDDEYDAYRKRMMLAYRFRPNPLNNPRRPYY